MFKAVQKSLKGKGDKNLRGELFKDGIIAGIGWAFGVTVGFVVISILLAILLQTLGGLPLIGNWLASIVEATQMQLLKRTPIISQ